MVNMNCFGLMIPPLTGWVAQWQRTSVDADEEFTIRMAAVYHEVQVGLRHLDSYLLLVEFL